MPPERTTALRARPLPPWLQTTPRESPADTADTLHTGGAAGADARFAEAAARAGHAVIVHTFAGHRAIIPRAASESAKLRPLPVDTRDADGRLAAAGRALARSGRPGSMYVRNLLRRNVMQATSARAVFAVASFEGSVADGADVRRPAHGVGVEGGTAWCCQVFADAWHERARPAAGATLPLYLFDQRSAQWWQARSAGAGAAVEWVRTPDVPHPSGQYAGIGARDLSAHGVRAIDALFERAA